MCSTKALKCKCVFDTVIIITILASTVPAIGVGIAIGKVILIRCTREILWNLNQKEWYKYKSSWNGVFKLYFLAQAINKQAWGIYNANNRSLWCAYNNIGAASFIDFTLKNNTLKYYHHFPLRCPIHCSCRLHQISLGKFGSYKVRSVLLCPAMVQQEGCLSQGLVVVEQCWCWGVQHQDPK